MAKRGRKKGSTYFVDLTYEQLGEFVGRKGIVKVSKAWLDSMSGDPIESVDMAESNLVEPEKIQYKIMDLNNE